jgi:hypothetical protein
MKLLLSALCASLTSSLLLQTFFAIWAPSSFGRFAELPVIVFCSVFPVALFFAVAAPLFWMLRRAGYRLQWPVAVFFGAALGVLVQLAFLATIGWPIRPPELVAAALGGGVGYAVYARMQRPSVDA